MYMSRSNFDKLDTSSLEAFIEQGIEEGTYLDYKRTISKPLSKDAKKELLKDVSGFANAGGGLIIYGSDEPIDGVLVSQQLTGISDGPKLAEDMERVLASSLDPRIPGLGVRCIKLQNSLHSILVHIPPSNVRPHMVTLDKRNQFYQRHSESTEIMNSQEVKSAVLSAYSREDAISQMQNHVMDMFRLSSFNRRGSCIVIQAIPLTSPVSKWDVFGHDIENVLRGTNSRTDFIQPHRFTTNYMPAIDVEERYSFNSRNEPRNWELHVKSNGHVYLFCHISAISDYQLDDRSTVQCQSFSAFTNHVYCAFGAVVDELLVTTGSSHGYHLSSTITSADQFVLQRGSNYGFGEIHGPLNRDTIISPIAVALPGESAEKCCENFGSYVYQAFGILPLDSELKTRGVG